MRLLHISDLHLTPPFTSLEEVWEGVAAQIRGDEFDAVIVSGDLAQAAGTDEYKQLLRFLRETMAKVLVTPGELGRIILVPGNHDVMWGAPIYRHIPVDDLEERDGTGAFRKALSEARYGGSSSRYRFRVSRSGTVHLYQTDETTYSKRFSNVDTFLRDIYPDTTSHLRRRFDLTTPGQDWSCHVFADHKIAIFGFNSCFGNDELWHGARFDPRAIAGAAAYARDHLAEHLLVAVWHHGLGGEEHREDHLRPNDLGNLFNAGFRVGFHGHTHRGSQSRIESLIGDRFLLVSTGSLGAGPSERPDAAGNQFSIAEVYASYARIERFEREGSMGVYRRSDVWTQSLLKRWDVNRPEVSAARHVRSYRVLADGLADVAVQMDDVNGSGVLVLAILTPPFCGYRYDLQAETDRGPIDIDKHTLPDGRVRFTVQLPSGSVRQLTWTYRISNAFLLAKREQEYARREGSPWIPDLLNGWCSRPYTVRVPTRELVLEWLFASDIDFAEKPLVERPTRDDERKRWQKVTSEAERCIVEELLIDGMRGRRVRLRGPTIGHRICMPYRPPDQPKDLPAAERILAVSLIKRTRGPVVNSGFEPWVDVVRLGIEHMVRDTLGIERLPGWQGTLWSSDERRLLASFGAFPRQDWGIRFPCGTGVTGHCFRIGRSVAWHRANDESELMYQSRPEGQDGPGDHQWLICVPLLVTPPQRLVTTPHAVPTLRGPAVGVVTFVGYKHSDCPKLEAWASEFSASDSTPAVDELETLQTVVNGVFWSALAAAPELAEHAALTKAIAARHAPTSE